MNWYKILRACGVNSEVAAQWAPIFETACIEAAFSKGLSDMEDFVGQILHESGRLSRLEENLNYTTPERLCAVWPSRFPTVESALIYVRNPRLLAEKVYGGRMGNSLEGDAWRFRGSGPIQVTGHENFYALQTMTGIPLLTHPELLRRPTVEALRVCIQWWEGNVPDAVLGNVKRETRVVNGGQEGLTDRQLLIAAASKAIRNAA